MLGLGCPLKHSNCDETIYDHTLLCSKQLTNLDQVSHK